MTNPLFDVLAPIITTALGTSITYTPPGGSASDPFDAVWDEDFRIITASEGVEIEGRVLAAHVRREDVAAPRKGATVTKTGVAYTVYEKQQNGPGMWTLLLEES